MLELAIKPRGKDSADTLRKGGAVPAVLYGPKEESTPIVVDARALEHIWKQAGQTSVVILKGVGEDKQTLVHEAQFHPVTGKMLHADFYVLEKGKKVRIKIPLEFMGQAPAEKLGHIIVKAMHELEIEVAPTELPHHLEVDLLKLVDLGSHILAKDIALPASAELITHADEIIASVTAFVEEKEEIAPAPVTEILTAKPDAGAEGATDASAEPKQEKPKSDKKPEK